MQSGKLFLLSFLLVSVGSVGAIWISEWDRDRFDLCDDAYETARRRGLQDIEVLKKCVEDDPRVLLRQEKNHLGDTLLHSAIRGIHGNPPNNDAVMYILSHDQGKKSIHIRNDHKESPLYLAVTSGNVEVVKTLLEAKADPNEKTPRGVELLRIVGEVIDRKKKVDLTHLLVLHGVPIIREDQYRHTHLYMIDSGGLDGVMLKAYVARQKLQEEQAQAILDAERSNNQSLFAAKEAFDQENARLREQLQNAAAQGEADRRQYQEIMRAAERETFRKQLALAVKLAQLQHEKRLAAQEGKEREEWEMVDAAM